MAASTHIKLVIALLIAVSCASCESGQSSMDKTEFVDALPPFAPYNCVSPNAQEQKAFELAVSAIELNGIDAPNWLDIGAQKYLSRYPFRKDGNNSIAVCIPEGILKRVANAFIARKGFGKGRLVEYQLELASRLPIRSDDIVRAVGQSAFNESFQQSELFPRQDIRPFARTVLASFGAQAKPYENIAYEQISIETSMGTGAAQVAAAAGHPDALPRIQRMMEETLSAVSSDKPIPRAIRNRLYELAWAVYYSGEVDKRYTKPIHQIMQRRVESWAPPFGLVALRPKRLCNVLKLVEGDESLRTYPFCLDEKVPLEQ